MKNIRGVVSMMAVALLLVTLVPAGVMGAKSERGASAEAQWTKERLQQMYVDYLKEKGYEPEIDSDGDVRFTREKFNYFVSVPDKDPTYFQVVLFNVWEIESEAERAKVLAACDNANARAKVAKIYTVKDNVWLSVEAFLNGPEDFKGQFERSLQAIDFAAGCFVERMRE